MSHTYKHIDADGAKTVFTYDADGAKMSIVDINRNETSVAIPMGALVSFIAECYVRPERISQLEAAEPDQLLRIEDPWR